MKNIKNLKVRAGALLLGANFALFGLSGCSIQKEAAPNEEYDIVGEETIDDNGITTKGLEQQLVVPGENFKLISKFRCDDDAKRQWRITSDKYLYIDVYTEGLSDETQVYIDNIHIDTSIKSTYACVDGILQDSMDDHIHNSQMIGFLINDTTHYYGVDAIEGCNEDFIKGTFYGYNGYSSGTITERRYTESDYRELGVYANKFQVVFDLLVKNPGEKDFHNVSVSTDFIVLTSEKEIEYTKTKSK